MIGAIVAIDPNGVIGVDGNMPWHYKEDFKRFKAVTMGSTLIMGRLTWESLPKPLPGRRCLVLTQQTNPTSKHPPGSCEYYPNLDIALLAAGSDQHGTNGDVWVAGGAQIYELSLTGPDVGVIDLTLVPEVAGLEGKTVVRFPMDKLAAFKLVSEEKNAADERLTHRRYERT